MIEADYGNGAICESPQIRADKRVFLRGGRILKGLAALSLLIPACSSGDGSENSERSAATAVKAAPVTTPSTPTTFPRPGPATLLPGSKHREVQQFGADTFVEYRNASGVGPRLPKGTVILADCLATGPEEAAPSARGKWYHITDDPNTTEDDQWVGYFVAANTFENGDTSGPLESQPAVDPAVPSCP